MASDLDGLRADEDTVVVGAGDDSTTEEDWPVADYYRVEPSPHAEPNTVVIAQQDMGSPRRRFYPDVGAGVMLAIGATVGALILGAFLLHSREDSSPARSTSSAGIAEATGSQPDAATSPATGDEQPKLESLAGLTVVEARASLEELGLRVRVNRVASDAPRGRVVDQTPEAGSRVAKGDLVVLTVSRGAAATPAEPALDAPDVVGLSASEAVRAIRAADLAARLRLVDSTERAGVVLRQSPEAGSEIAAGSTIELEVARSRPVAVARVEVPDVIGTQVGEARARLRALGFVVKVVRARAEEAAGTVVQQSPRAGVELRKGSALTLTVSTGPARVTIPDVTGLDEASARLELESAGFEVRVTEESTHDSGEDGVVLRQTPSGGSTAKEGAIVALVVGRYD